MENPQNDSLMIGNDEADPTPEQVTELIEGMSPDDRAAWVVMYLVAASWAVNGLGRVV